MNKEQIPGASHTESEGTPELSFSGIEEGTGTIDKKVPGIALSDFLITHMTAPQIMTDIATLYVSEMEKAEEYTMNDAQKILDSVTVHENSELRGGYVFKVLIDFGDGLRYPIQFHVPKESVATIH